MNVITMERVAGVVLKALKDENLMGKEAAAILDISPVYLSCIGNSKSYHHVSKRAWQVMHDWAQLGVPLKGFKPEAKVGEEMPEAEQAAKEAEAYMKAQGQAQATPEQTPAPETPPLTKEEKKAKKAARIRELYERSKPPKKDPKPEDVTQPEPGAQPGQPDTLIISREGDKVDLSKINLRTGTTIFTAEVTDNEIIIRFPLVRMERATK